MKTISKIILVLSFFLFASLSFADTNEPVITSTYYGSMALQGSNFEDTFKIDLFNDGTATVETFGKSFTMWIEASSQGEITLRNEYNEVLTISNFAGQSRLELPNLIGELKNCLVGTLRKLF